jgi:hypothetical protein
LLTDSQCAPALEFLERAEDRLVSPEALATAVRHADLLPPRPGVTCRIGVDLGLRHDRTAIAVCHAEPDGYRRRVVLDRLLAWQGTRGREVQLAEVERAIVELSRQYNRARVQIDACSWSDRLVRIARLFRVPRALVAIARRRQGRPSCRRDPDLVSETSGR